ncbi:conserved hypothetical protein [Gammaproteobacteria bacterium]
MKYLSPALQALLATGQFWSADLYEITLLSETVLRLTTSDYGITSGGHVFTCSGPLIERSTIKQSIGASVDDLTVTLYPKDTDLVDGISFLKAIRRGNFDGATLAVYRAFMPTAGDVSAGLVKRFSGRFGPIDADRTSAEITVKSWAELLNIQWPRITYTPGCPLTLFETACGASRASFTFNGTIATGSTLSTINVTGLTSKANGYFDTGIAAFSGGLVRRSVKSWASNVIHLATPLYELPTVGAVIALTAGCDKTTATCDSRFWGANYVLHFQGQPWIPDPETAA